jgi:hypothetical protein
VVCKGSKDDVGGDEEQTQGDSAGKWKIRQLFGHGLLVDQVGRVKLLYHPTSHFPVEACLDLSRKRKARKETTKKIRRPHLKKTSERKGWMTMKVVWVGLQLLVFCLTDLGRPLEMGRMREAKGEGDP